MQQKKKLCSGCNTLQYIWKNIDGHKYCKACAYSMSDNKLTINKVSSKRRDEMKEYSLLRKQFLQDHPFCEANLQGCTHNSSEVHHKAGRIGRLYLDTSKWAALCHNCHKAITEDSKMAIELGLSLSRLKKDDKEDI